MHRLKTGPTYKGKVVAAYAERSRAYAATGNQAAARADREQAAQLDPSLAK
jgi:hypothetical protein